MGDRVELILIGAAMILYASLPLRVRRRGRRRKRRVPAHGPLEIMLLLVGIGLVLYGIGTYTFVE